MNEQQKRRVKGRITMAVMTAKCDRTFVVSAEKAQVFKDRKRDENAMKKINSTASKLQKRLKIDDEQQ